MKQSRLNITRELCTIQGLVLNMAKRPYADVDGADVTSQPSLQVDKTVSVEPASHFDAAVALQSPDQLDVKDIAGEWYLAVLPYNEPILNQHRLVPLAMFKATWTDYIGICKEEEEARDRGMFLWNGMDKLKRASLKLLRIRFSHRGFATYACTDLGRNQIYHTMFHKNVYKKHDSKDWGVWSFYGDLPFVELDADGHWLIDSNWVETPQPSPQINVTMGHEIASQDDVAVALMPPDQIDDKDIAGIWLLAVLPEFVRILNESRLASLAMFKATRKNYIGLRRDEEEARLRGMLLWNAMGQLQKSSLKLLRITFSHRGFSKYAHQSLGKDQIYRTKFHKNVEYSDISKDWGAWSFYGDLPLEEMDADRHWLIVSNWVEQDD